jgi:hypothetical protein
MRPDSELRGAGIGEGMRRGLLTIMAVALLALVPASAAAKRHHSHKPAGVTGEVLNSTCPGACAEPPPPQPLYTGPVTVTVTRVSDSVVVASQAISDGHFRMRVKRGLYDVSAVPPNPPTCQPTPETVCPLTGAQQAAVIAPCLEGETQRVQVRRHHFTHVELHVRNVCIV